MKVTMKLRMEGLREGMIYEDGRSIGGKRRERMKVRRESDTEVSERAEQKMNDEHMG